MEKNKGFIGKLLLIIIGLALLKYFFDWSIFDAIESERGKETVGYIRKVLDFIWSYLARPLNYIWNEIIEPAMISMISNFNSQ